MIPRLPRNLFGFALLVAVAATICFVVFASSGFRQ